MQDKVTVQTKYIIVLKRSSGHSSAQRGTEVGASRREGKRWKSEGGGITGPDDAERTFKEGCRWPEEPATPSLTTPSHSAPTARLMAAGHVLATLASL